MLEGMVPGGQLATTAALTELQVPATDHSRKHSLPPTTEPSAKRSKKGKKAKTGSKAAIPELNPSDYVRVVKVTNRDDLLHEGPVMLSKSDKANQMTLSDNRLTVTSSKGYRMHRLEPLMGLFRAHGTLKSLWFTWASMAMHAWGGLQKKETFKRLSGMISTALAIETLRVSRFVTLAASCFLLLKTSNSCCVLSPVQIHALLLSLLQVHQALREEYGEPYTEGDVIGCFLHMPEGGRAFEKEKSDIVTWKGELYFVDEPTADPAKLEGSLVAFTKNGQVQGIAYRDIKEGTYSPAASMYTDPTKQKDGAVVTFNFGPDFAYLPPQLDGYPPARPVAELSGPPDDLAFPPPDTETGLLEAAR
ncbi:hypothetical protein ABBQ38_010102 [Trebouxia sp. C0009 RCD-2024]